MKVYPKTFEDVFTSRQALNRCHIEKIKIRDFETNEDYILFARKELRKIMEGYWMSVIKASWLFFKFTYDGKRRNKMYANNTATDAAFAVFHKQYVGIDLKVFTREVPYFNKLFDYLVDYYPDFDEHNPFEDDGYFKFPYKNISVDYMLPVYQMPERLEILAYAEEHPMNYNEYLDWILNYINSYNEEHQEEIYLFYFGNEKIPFVRYKNYSHKDNLKKYNLKKYDPTTTKQS